MYPLYQLLFTDHGLSTSQVSTLFIIWSTTAFLLEVPSGAWADVFSRRKLLMLGSALSGLGYASWILLPTYAGFALGFILWGISSALISGTFEALVYDELAARGTAHKYAGLIGRAKAARAGPELGCYRIGGSAVPARWLLVGGRDQRAQLFRAPTGRDVPARGGCCRHG
ncbi:MFS transporter [Kribbella qitaiheensis]|uniref:MFS transporter n=1 Tax=Kribbella qitaiheensis TaxID=1544730 RepID=UPI001FE28809|nr:MFS transporter [Kribbella qitaiheensis]